MSISNEEVNHLANLSKLNFSDEKLDKYAQELSKIVEFADTLSKVDINGVAPTAHILDIKNVFRKDEKENSYKREEILKNAPDSEAGCVSVPKTLE